MYMLWQHMWTANELADLYFKIIYCLKHWKVSLNIVFLPNIKKNSLCGCRDKFKRVIPRFQAFTQSASNTYSQRWALFDNANFQNALSQEPYIESLRNFTEASVTEPCCKLRYKKFLLLLKVREIGKVSKWHRQYFIADTFA